MDLIVQYDLYNAWHDLFSVAVIIGVLLEVFETIAEVRRKPEEWQLGPEYLEGQYPRLITSPKPKWQNKFAAVGWAILFFGLLGELIFSELARRTELRIRSASDQQIERLVNELSELRSLK